MIEKDKTYFGHNLRILRKKSGLNQTELGLLFHATKSTVSKWENNEQEPSFSTLKDIAAHFNVTTDYLLSNDAENSGGKFMHIQGYEEVVLGVFRTLIKDITRDIIRKESSLEKK